MNLLDLKDVLDEHSADSTGQVLHHMRLSGVRAKVATRRRRRAVISATCAVVAMVAVGTATAILRAPADPPPATPAASDSPTPTIEGFPEYANGARVVAAKSATLPTRSASITFVPSTLDLVIFTRCAGQPEQVVPLEVETTVNGRMIASGGCDGSFRPRDWDGFDVKVGSPVTVAVTVTGASAGDQQVAIPDVGTYGVAIGERIPFTAYPLPPRPTTLKPFEPALPAGGTQADYPGAFVLRADPVDPSRPQRLTVTWRSVDGVEAAAQTPGLLHVKVNGVEVATGEWWDYDQSGFGGLGDAEWEREFGLKVRPGQRVTIEVVPEHVTGDWNVIFVPKGALAAPPGSR